MPKPKLVKKTCKCGCKKTWRALPGSPNEYFSDTHGPRPAAQVAKDRKYVRQVYQWLTILYGEDEKRASIEAPNEIECTE